MRPAPRNKRAASADSQLRKIDGGPAEVWEWVRPGVDWKPYTKVYIEPGEVWVNPQAAYPGIEPGLYKKALDLFVADVTQELRAGGYQVVEQAGPGVLKLHYALTGVNPQPPGFNPLDVLPAMIAINTVRYATGTQNSIVAISAEVEYLDGVTNQRLAEFVLSFLKIRSA